MSEAISAAGRGSAPQAACGKLGICVLTYNSAEVVAECLAALERALAGLQHEIVLVDNASSDGSAEVGEQSPAAVHVIRNAANVGYARGNNIGARWLLEQGCRFLAFVNPDVTVGAETLLAMCAGLEELSRAGCVGGVAVDGERTFAGAFRSRPSLAEKLWIYSSARYLPVISRWLTGPIARMEARHFTRLESPQPVYAVSGACIMFSAAAFREVEGFDEHTFLYQEEFIISERLRRAGHEVYGIPAATYHHRLGHSTHVNAARSRRCFIESEQYYLRRYYGSGAAVRMLVRLFRWADLRAWIAAQWLKGHLRRSHHTAACQ